ncbi:MAG: magnesium/cobalt transporter CorA [Candidatus Omnitrophica bacterium]|nr:magnesium/cobalt transporter CorA [Candidatus Omnitrophota bacterium]
MLKSYCRKKDGSLIIDVNRDTIKGVLTDEENLIWIDVEDPDDNDIEVLLEVFGLHAMTVEDCIMPNTRPKIEQFDNYTFLVLHTIGSIVQPDAGDMTLSANGKRIGIVELDICLGKNYLITFHTEPVRVINATRDKAEKKSPIMSRGPDFLLYHMADGLVDNYFPVVDELDNKIDKMEEEILTEPSKNTLKKLYDLKMDTMFLRRIIGPERDAINLLIRNESPFIRPQNQVYFRDVYDHMVRLSDLLDVCREITTSAVEIYMIVSSNKLNEIIKTLTILATIATPSIIIASIYGMNFKYMPELGFRYGYLLVLLVMVLTTVFMVVFFKRRKWL